MSSETVVSNYWLLPEIFKSRNQVINDTYIYILVSFGHKGSLREKWTRIKWCDASEQRLKDSKTREKKRKRIEWKT